MYSRKQRKPKHAKTLKIVDNKTNIKKIKNKRVAIDFVSKQIKEHGKKNQIAHVLN